MKKKKPDTVEVWPTCSGFPRLFQLHKENTKPLQLCLIDALKSSEEGLDAMATNHAKSLVRTKSGKRKRKQEQEKRKKSRTFIPKKTRTKGQTEWAEDNAANFVPVHQIPHRNIGTVEMTIGIAHNVGAPFCGLSTMGRFLRLPTTRGASFALGRGRDLGHDESSPLNKKSRTSVL